MLWTKTKPAEEGYYWCRCKNPVTGQIHETVVKVCYYGKIVCWNGKNFYMDDEAFTEWSDAPVPKPEF